MPFGFGLSLPVNSLMRGSGAPAPGPTPTLALQFVGATTLDPRITFTRATTATFFSSSGVLTSAAINAPRFDYNPATLQPLGLLIERMSTNTIYNNTMVGAVAGTPGTLPTNWAAQINTTTGLTSQIVGVGTDSGISYIDYRISGTASGAGSFELFFETANNILSFVNEPWAAAFYWKLQAGSTTGLSAAQYRSYEYNSAIEFLTATSVNVSFPTSAALNTQRATVAYTISNGSTEWQRPLIAFNIANGAVIDITLRIGMPQLEQNEFATSVIPTTSVQVTRGSDLPRLTGTNFSTWYNASTSTVFAEFQITLRTSAQTMVSFNNTTLADRITLAASEVRFSAVRDTANAGTVTSPVTANAPIAGINKVALAFANFDVAICGNSGSVVTATNYAVPSVTQMQIGNQLSSTFLSGHIRRIDYYPSRLSNAALQTLTA